MALRLNLRVRYSVKVIQPVVWLGQLLVDLIKLAWPQLGGVSAHGGSHVVVMFKIAVKIEGITPAKLCAGLANARRPVTTANASTIVREVLPMPPADAVTLTKPRMW